MKQRRKRLGIISLEIIVKGSVVCGVYLFVELFFIELNIKVDCSDRGSDKSDNEVDCCGCDLLEVFVGCIEEIRNIRNEQQKETACFTIPLCDIQQNNLKIMAKGSPKQVNGNLPT